MVKKKKLLSCVCIAALGTVLTICAATGAFGHSSVLRQTAEEQTYSFTLDSSKAITADQVTAKEATYQTALGNPLTFAFEGMAVEDGKYGSVDGIGSYIEVKTTNMIKGIKSIEINCTTTDKGAYAIFGGTEKANAIEEYRYANGNDGEHVNVKTVTFNTPLNYVRLENIGKLKGKAGTAASKVVITSLKFNYCCEETPSRDLIEKRSNSFMRSAEVAWAANWDLTNAPIVTNCTDTANAYSGYSWYCETNTAATGWPNIQYNMNKTYDFTKFGLSFYAKFEVAHPWISVKLYDKSWAQVTDQLAVDVKQGSWQKIEFTPAQIAAKLCSGKTVDDLKEIQLMVICVNFDAHTGNVQKVWLDEFHLLEDLSTFGKNMENIKIDTGDSKSNQTIDYTVFKGANSSSSVKLTFANASASESGDDALKTAFSTQEQWGNSNPVLNAGTLEFDMKPSLDIVNSSTSGNKHMVSVDVIGSDWSAKGAWVDIVNSGSAGYTTFWSEDGWYHCKINLADQAKIAACTTANIRIRLNFFGISTANKDVACVYVDNFNWTPAA